MDSSQAAGGQAERYPHPDENLVLLQRFYDELNRDLEGLRVRCSAAVAASLAFLSAFAGLWATDGAISSGHGANGLQLALTVTPAALGSIALLTAVGLFVSTFLLSDAPSAYAVDELRHPSKEHGDLWSFRFRQVHLTAKAVMERKELLDRRSGLFTVAVMFAGAGILLLLASLVVDPAFAMLCANA